MKQTLFLQKSASFFGTLAVLIFGFTGIAYLQQSKLKPQENPTTKAEYLQQEKLEKLQLDFLKVFPALGFENVLADWIYLRFIQYFGDGEARENTGYSLSPDYFTAVVDRDPKFVDAHLKLAASTSIFAGEPQITIQLLDKSLQSVPVKLVSASYRPYYLWVYKGIDELLFLGDTEAAKKSYITASQWAKTYDDSASQGLAERTQATAQFLAKNPRSIIAQIGAWSMVLSSTSDTKTQQRALIEIKGLGGEVVATPEGKLVIKVPDGIL